MAGLHFCRLHRMLSRRPVGCQNRRLRMRTCPLPHQGEVGARIAPASRVAGEGVALIHFIHLSMAAFPEPTGNVLQLLKKRSHA